MIHEFKMSNNIDCRVNAFPSFTDYKGIHRYPPNFIFADLDISTFSDLQSLEGALQTTLKLIRNRINGFPTVLCTGNGYHIYQPLEAVILEEFTQFEEFEKPSLKFLRFAERMLTAGQSDRSHYPSFKSSMIRIPGSYNSKSSKTNSEVKIFQKWDGYRPSINLLLGTFHAFLVDQKIKEMKLKKRIEKRYGKAGYHNNVIPWIESLLEIPIDDYRKNAIGLILAPYLINIRQISYDEAFLLISEWLDKCNLVRTLDTDFSFRIKYCLNTAVRKNQLPIRLSTLEKKNKELYNLLAQKKHESKATGPN